jgi:hypothetical protein
LAALCIQTDWRMLRNKWRYHHIKRQTVLIQKCWRGYVGRIFARKASYQVKMDRRIKFFTEQARII